MKRFFLMLILLGFLCCLSACSSSRYVMITEDYAIHVGHTEPVLDTQTNIVHFEDAHGEMVSLPKDAIKQTREIR